MQRLATFLLTIALLAIPKAANAQIVNGGFESGDYSGWTLEGTTIDNTFAIVTSSSTISPTDFVFDFLDMVPEEQTSLSLPWSFFAAEGEQTAVLLTNGPSFGRMYQDVALPQGFPSLLWSMDWQNHHTNFDPVDQFIEISVRDPNTDAILMSLFKTTDGLDPLFVFGGEFNEDLSAFAGQVVRIDITSASNLFFLDYTIDNITVIGGATCGDFMPDFGEDCDEGGETATCDGDCTFVECGDGTTNMSALEECDDAGESMFCNFDCTLSACGDGTTNVTASEECDDSMETATCDADCTFVICGDGTTNIWASEICDDGGESATCDADCTFPACGDGTLNTTAGEECETEVETAVCDADCTFVICGDGNINMAAGEVCDDSGESALCDADCTPAVCGDGVTNVSAGEQCDDGNNIDSDECPNSCNAPICGDGIWFPPFEQCDDGNNQDGDACNSVCGADSDFDAISDLDEVDDDNLETPPTDTDGDLTPDFLDEDSDNDTIADIDEAGDFDLLTPPVDSNDDLEPDFRDEDSDGDGVADSVEAGDAEPSTPPVDTDGDLIPDYRDTDSDDDDVLDAIDNCRTVKNPDQLDTNDDGQGDACSNDDDGDGVDDTLDNCPLIANPGQEDTDANGLGDACDEVTGGEFQFGGGGECGIGNSKHAGASWVFILLAVVFAGRRRRGPGARQSRRSGLRALFLASLFPALLVGNHTASAQVQIEENLNIDRFVLSGDPDGILNVEWATVPAHLRWNLSFLMAGVGDPLVARRDGSEYAIVSTRYTSSLGGSIALFNRVQLMLSMPLIVSQSGDLADGLAVDELNSTALGDLRFAPKVQLYRGPGFWLSFIPAVTVPTASAGRFAGEQSLTFAPMLAASTRLAGWRVAANLGYLARKNALFAESVVGDEVSASVGVGYRFGDHGGPRFELNASAAFSFAASGSSAQTDRTYGEALVGGSYWLSDSLSAVVGGGTGLTGGLGAPTWRVMVGARFSPRVDRALALPPPSSFEIVTLLPDENGHVGSIEVDDGKTTTVIDTAYASTEIGVADEKPRTVQRTAETVKADVVALAAALPPLDRDFDNIVDADDSCPDRAGPASPNPMRHGCPESSEKIVVLPDEDGHVGAIEVDDGTTTTLLNQAYATAEVSAEGKAQKVAPSKAVIVERAIAAVGASLPVADDDGDGIADGKDACPTRPGVSSPDSLRNGCPQASERVVVLPDEDGHVGGIEIDDGQTKTVIDTAYASAEVSADGAVAAIAPSTTPNATDRAVAILAAAMPIADEDSDGIADAVDACPARPGIASANLMRNGCPAATEVVVVLPDEDGTVGAIEVDDGTTKTVLDKAYATSEVDKSGRAVAVSGARPSVVLRSIAALAQALPPADLDGDGIIDLHDACKTRPGRTNANALLHGCPRSVEKIVLIPDMDGHIGAIEVGEGDAMITIDQAYATAEIGEDGGAVTLRTPPDEVERQFQGAMSARSDYTGARIVVYFNEKAQPTFDVTEQIAFLVADLTGREGYVVEIVGHTDETGSKRANLRISRARAKLVADRLKAAGIPAGALKITAMGSAAPSVKVKDPSIPELRNRRVEVFVK